MHHTLDQRSARVRQARIALIRAVRRKSMMACEGGGLATPQPLLPADIDAAWDAGAKPVTLLDTCDSLAGDGGYR